MLQTDSLEDALEALGSVLEDRGFAYSLAVIGGGALLLRGDIRRPTKDLDVAALVEDDLLATAEPLPEALSTAVFDVAAALELAPDWVNAGPTSVLQLGLPAGFLERCTVATYGSLTLYIAGRTDLIALKLYAAADHWPSRYNKHLDDLRQLTPTTEELPDAARWCTSHDPSPGFREHQLDPCLAALGVGATDA